MGGIQKILSKAGEADIGTGIGELRNEIAHVGKPKELLGSLSITDMIKISQYLQMTIIGYILTRLGVDRNLIDDYQIRLTPDA